jgi:hypothetical protein
MVMAASLVPLDPACEGHPVLHLWDVVPYLLTPEAATVGLWLQIMY